MPFSSKGGAPPGKPVDFNAAALNKRRFRLAETTTTQNSKLKTLF
jgi:hypothetical protein